MIEVLLTTLETEMSTTAVDQDQVLAEQTVDQDLAEQTVDQDLAEQTVDQDLAEQIAQIVVSAEQIAQIAGKVHEAVRAPKTTGGISSEVAYQFIKHLENNQMFRKELMACERCKWADYLILLTHSKGSTECGKKILAEFNVFLTEPLLKILGI